MTTHTKRTRMGVAVATALLSVASVFALASPASANAVPPDPVNNLTAVGGVNEIKVDWETAQTGEPATSFVVTLEKKQADNSYAPSGDPTIVLMPATEVVLKPVGAGVYRVNVFSKNAYPGFGLAVTVNDITVTDPVIPPNNPIVDTRPYRPYADWQSLIVREYQLMTGCGVEGRKPRLDELTFWQYNIAQKPFTQGELDFRSNLYNNLLNVALTDPDGAGPKFAPADTNKNGIIEAGELTAAQNLAFAQATNEVYFQRRTVFMVWLAEEAEQTDGPAARLYTAYFSRDADMGVCFWSRRIRAKKLSLLQVSDFFVNSKEFVDTYGEYTTNQEEEGTDAAEFVALIYKNVLNRTPDGAGFAFWTRQLQSQRKSPAEVMIGFSESQEFKTRMSPRVGAFIGYAHLLGVAPTNADYVRAEFFNEYFATSPSGLGFSWNSELYRYIIDLPAYKARAIPAPAAP